MEKSSQTSAGSGQGLTTRPFLREEEFRLKFNKQSSGHYWVKKLNNALFFYIRNLKLNDLLYCGPTRIQTSINGFACPPYLRGLRGLNSRLVFWRHSWYHFTKPPFFKAGGNTTILPLNYRPMALNFSLFMNSMFFTPLAIFFKLEFSFLTLFSTSIIIKPLTNNATHFY